MPLADDLVQVYVSQGPLGAQVAHSKLVAEGIPAMLRYEPVGRALGLTVDGLGQVAVLVRPQDASRAREILSEDESAANDEQFSPHLP